MAISFNAELDVLLDAAQTKSQWFAALQSALGPTRRVIADKDGTVFRNCALTGTMSYSGGFITNLGTTSDTTVNLAADISSGTSTINITGNGHTMTGTLGLAGSECDFIMRHNPTTNNGFGFGTVAIAAPAALPDGDDSGIDNIAIYFGATTAPVAVTLAEQVYTDMPIGFSDVTQSRWKSDPITANGIEFTVYPGIDSDGRVDCWIYADFVEAADTLDVEGNREYADVDLEISVYGVPLNLFGEGTTYTYEHQRTTWLRWQSEEIVWVTSNAYIEGLIDDGTFLKHDSRNIFGTLENQYDTNLPTVVGYKPFKTFSDISQTTKIGDQNKSTPAGGERTSIGPVHEWYARLISEVGTNNNEEWLTADRLQILKDLAETAAQYPHASGLLGSDGRLLDPSVGPYSTHRNPDAWEPCIGIPQPGFLFEEKDGLYDNAHPYNKVSFQAYHLSKDPWHLFQTQGQAIACLAYGTGLRRGVDGTALRIVVEEERGFWWGFQSLIHAWHATPSGTMPAPFRSKAFFATAIENTLQYIRDKYMTSLGALETGVHGEAVRYWRILAPFELGDGEIYLSPFMCDYGHIVMAEALLLGYSGARDVAEWHAVNAQLRAELGGNWYGSDETKAGAGFLAQSVALTTDTNLDYSNAAEYKAWYPRPTDYEDGVLDASTDWVINSGRDTYMWVAVLNLYKELNTRGLITLGFNAATAEATARTNHPAPYLAPNTNPWNYVAWAKQYYSY